MPAYSPGDKRKKKNYKKWILELKGFQISKICLPQPNQRNLHIPAEILFWVLLLWSVTLLLINLDWLRIIFYIKLWTSWSYFPHLQLLMFKFMLFSSAENSIFLSKGPSLPNALNSSLNFLICSRFITTVMPLASPLYFSQAVIFYNPPFTPASIYWVLAVGQTVHMCYLV